MFKNYKQGNDGKIVDIDVGLCLTPKPMIGIVTEQGKLFVINDEIKKSIVNEQKQQDQSNKDCFQILFSNPDWKATKVFCGRRDN